MRSQQRSRQRPLGRPPRCQSRLRRWCRRDRRGRGAVTATGRCRAGGCCVTRGARPNRRAPPAARWCRRGCGGWPTTLRATSAALPRRARQMFGPEISQNNDAAQVWRCQTPCQGAARLSEPSIFRCSRSEQPRHRPCGQWPRAPPRRRQPSRHPWEDRRPASTFRYRFAPSHARCR